MSVGRNGTDAIEFQCGGLIHIYEDVRIVVYMSTLFGKEKIMQFWFHTRFIEGDRCVSQ